MLRKPHHSTWTARRRSSQGLALVGACAVLGLGVSFWETSKDSATAILGSLGVAALVVLYFLSLRRRLQVSIQEARLVAIVKCSDDAIIGKSLDGVVTDWNRAAERMFGYSEEEAVGRKIMDLILPCDRQSEEGDILAQMAIGQPVSNLLTRRKRRDGTEFDAAVSISPVRDGDGKVVGAAKIVRDISQQKATEASLSLTQAHLAAIVQSSEKAIIGQNLEGVITSWNAGAERLFSYPATGVLGRRMVDVLVPPDLHAEELQTLFEIEKGGSVAHVRTIRLKSDGTRLEVALSVSPIILQDGTLVGAATVAGDFSVEAAAERQIRELNASLERQVAERTQELQAFSALQSAIVSHAGYAVIATNEAGVITLFNPAAEAMLGYLASDMIGQGTLATFHDRHEMRKRAASLSDALGEPIEPGLDVLVARARRGLSGMDDWTYVRKDGRRLQVRLDVSELLAKDGTRLGFLGIARDLTDDIRRESDLNVAKQNAEAATNAKSEFLAAMSHELRTPLNSIIGFSGLMLDSGDLSGETLHRYAGLVHEASKTLLSVVNGVLDVSKLEASSLELDVQPFSLRDLVGTTADLMRSQADGKGVALHTEVSDDLPLMVLGDDVRLRQVLLNLLANALKFTAKGEVVIKVKAVGVASQTLLRFSVTDTGIGIPASQRHRIFQRFSQVDGSTSRRFGGTGLGLSICKSLVELMGGDIGFESVDGRGSEFWFVVPLPIATDHDSEEILDDARDMGGDRPATILLAEDLLVNQELAVSLLRRWGHRVDVVADGAAAIDAVQHKAYDLVLMDIQMPTIDGVEATLRIRSLGGCYTTMPIIAMTANVMAKDIETFRKAGMNDHIGKPFLPRELRRVVRQWTTSAPEMILPSTSIRMVVEIDRDAAKAEEGMEPSEPIDFPLMADDLLNETIFAAFQNVVGTTKAHALMRHFASDLTDRFTEIQNRDVLGRDAHAIASSAGMLGFLFLSRTARALEHACRDGSAESAPLNALLQSRLDVKTFIDRRFGAARAA